MQIWEFFFFESMKFIMLSMLKFFENIIRFNVQDKDIIEHTWFWMSSVSTNDKLVYHNVKKT